jgi:L-alanine-DL-glutamate epimerase-like enolase superfamily enzyme
MTVAAEIFPIRLPEPFRIAHGSTVERETVLVTVTDGARTGRGEGALPPYYPSRAEACLAWVRAHGLSDPLPAAPPEAAAARVAVEMARVDLAAQRAGVTVRRFFGLPDTVSAVGSWTLSIPENETALRRALASAREAGAVAFKLKSGSGDADWDLACVRLVAAAGCPFSVDANGGWTPDGAARLLPVLADLGVLYAEEPVGPAEWADLRARLRGRTVPPLVADESLQTAADFDRLAGLADGVNVKILKAGGLRAAGDWLRLARALGFRVLLGVMVETGIGRTAAAHLAPLADWLDIDPPTSIPTAPFCGFSLAAGRVAISSAPGLGLRGVLTPSTGAEADPGPPGWSNP